MAFKDIMETVKSETSDAIEITKKKSAISKQRAKIKDCYRKLGENIYKNHRELIEDEEMKALMEQIDEAFDVMNKCNEEIDRIKMNK